MKNLTSKQSGLTLIEILVALVISLFLLSGIIQVYLGNKATYRFSDASSRLQENGRFALDSITTDARLAGFFGCVDLEANKNLNAKQNLIQNHLSPGTGYYDFINESPVQVTPNVNGSDQLTLTGSKPGQANIVTTLTKPGSAAVEVAGSTPFADNSIVLITNCWTSDIFVANSASTTDGVTTLTHTLATSTTAPSNTTVNSTCAAGAHCLHGSLRDNLESAYIANNSSAYRLQNVVYSIQPASSGNGEPALWRAENGDDQELIEGIERMVILYGVDNDGDGTPNQYQDSNAAVDLDDVRAIRVFLVAVSENDNVIEGNQNYTLNGVSINAPDRRLRQVFSTTIDLRNR